MFGKNFILVFLLLPMVACAEPKYLTATGPQSSTTQKGVEADCSIRFKNSELCLSWAWQVYPTESAPGSLVFKIFRPNLADKTQVEVDPTGVVSVLLWMPSMGHGSSPTQVTRQDVGTFLAQQVYFVMPGEWEIKFQIKAEGALQDEAVVTLIF